jgi:tetratricopeptide (TPR) repeat protein
MIFGQEDIEWLDHMELEHDNLRAALEWATLNQIEKALKLAYHAGSFWTARDYNHEARSWCRSILERSKSLSGMDALRARVYGVLGWNSIAIGDHKTGREAAEAGAALAHSIADQRTLGRLQAVIGLACTFLGDFPAAEAAILEAEASAREQGSSLDLALMLTTHAQMVYFAYGDVAKARTYLEQAMALRPSMELRWATTMSIFGMARLAGMIGDLDTARAKFLESAAFAKRVGNKRLMYSCYSELAHVLRENGALDEPLGFYRDLLPKWRDLGHRAAVAHELECIAYILAKKDQAQRAVTILGAAQSLRTLIGSNPTSMEQAEYAAELAALRPKLSDLEFGEAWNVGQSLNMDAAISFALSES